MAMPRLLAACALLAVTVLVGCGADDWSAAHAKPTAIGTLGYMAPEQMKNAKAAGPEVDVWALGAILYECLAGVKLYRAKSALELLDLVEQGTHEELIARRGLYTSLYGDWADEVA